MELGNVYEHIYVNSTIPQLQYFAISYWTIYPLRQISPEIMLINCYIYFNVAIEPKN